MRKNRQLLTSTVLVIAFFGISKVTGLIRGRLIATRFNLGPELDAFTAANQLPELFFVLIAGGALAAAFIPIYTEYIANEKIKESLALTHSTLSLVILILGLVAGISAIFAPQIAAVLTPNFSAEQQQLQAELMRIILIQTFLFGISGVLTSFLNGNNHFALPALASVALDIGYGIGIFFFVPTMGVHGLAWGTVVGAVLHILIQFPALIIHKFSYSPIIAWRLAGVREIIRLMGPRIVTLGTIQFADLFIIRLLSGLPSGSTSGYFFGYSLQQLPETLFGTAIALVVFPTMAEYFNQGKSEEMVALGRRALGIIWTLTIPSAVGLIVIGRLLVQVIFEGGEFTAESTNIVYVTLIFFSLRVVAEGTLEIVARLLYAQHDTFTPMLVYGVWLVVQVGAAYLLIGALGIGGVALASTLAFTVLSTILFIINERRLGGLNHRELWLSGGRATLASAGMGLVLWLVLIVFNSPALASLSGALRPILFTGLTLATSLVLGGLTYVGLNWILGGRELRDLLGLAFSRFRTETPA